MSKLKWILTGKNVPRMVYTIFSSPIIALVIAILAFILAAAASLFAEEIKTSTAFLVFNPRNRGINDLVLGFWFLSFLWAFMLYIRLIVEGEHQQKLKTAIHRAPNPLSIHTYDHFYHSINEIFRSPAEENETDEERIKAALQMICDFTKYFSAKYDSELNANIMLVVRVDSISDAFINRLANMAPLIKKGESIKEYSGVLYMDESLTIKDDKDPMVPIALPVPSEITDEYGYFIALPGAPLSFLTGQLVVYGDIDEFMAACKDFHAGVQNKIRDYFGKGNGSWIKSFLSIRIDYGEREIGVLNINSSSKNILGEEPEYYQTYKALMTPVLNILAGPVQRVATELVKSYNQTHNNDS